MPPGGVCMRQLREIVRLGSAGGVQTPDCPADWGGAVDGARDAETFRGLGPDLAAWRRHNGCCSGSPDVLECREEAGASAIYRAGLGLGTPGAQAQARGRPPYALALCSMWSRLAAKSCVFQRLRKIVKICRKLRADSFFWNTGSSGPKALAASGRR